MDEFGWLMLGTVILVILAILWIWIGWEQTKRDWQYYEGMHPEAARFRPSKRLKP